MCNVNDALHRMHAHYILSVSSVGQSVSWSVCSSQHLSQHFGAKTKMTFVYLHQY